MRFGAVVLSVFVLNTALGQAVPPPDRHAEVLPGLSPSTGVLDPCIDCDAIYASGRLVQLLAATRDPLSSLRDAIPRYHATPEIRIECADDRKFAVVERVLSRYRDTHSVVDVDGARIDFPDGWGLVRASNTQPVLVLRAEGATPAVVTLIPKQSRELLH